MTRKPPNPKPWYCIACGGELPPDRQQGRCRDCLIGKRQEASDPTFVTSDSQVEHRLSAPAGTYAFTPPVTISRLPR